MTRGRKRGAGAAGQAASKARAAAAYEAMPEAPWLLEVPRELIGDAATLAKVVGSHRLAFGYKGALVLSVSSPRMTAELVPMIFEPARGNA
jgi:hypothetical protein